MLDIPKQHKEIFETIGNIAETAGQQVFVVGGYVRDYYLQRLNPDDITDIDFVTVGSGIALAKKIADELNTSKLTIFKKFGTAQIKYKDLDLEFVGARKESYRRDSRKPIVEDGTLEDDQLRRDLTINALSWCLNPDQFGVLYDPFNGTQDLKNKIVRTPIDPEQTFDDDPLRMMRAVRFATQLQFDIDRDTFAAISKMAHRLSIISKERILDELNKIVLSPKPSIGFAHLLNTGLLKEFFPEMVNLIGVDERNGQRHKDNFWHTLKVLDNTAEKSDDLWLRWAAIMHDIAKPPTKKFVKGIGWTFHGHDALGAKWVPRIFKRLGLPLDERMRYVQKLVRLHLRPIALVSEEVSDSAVRRLIYEAGEDIDDLMTLCRADITSKNEWRRKKYRNNFDRVEKKIVEVEEKDRMRNWKNPIGGDEIMQELGVKPGPIVGKVKDRIKNAILDGDIPNNYDAAYDYLQQIKSEYVNSVEN
ncbi:CCA tRNA nucleotidyltransferase [Rhodohalobacter barkolensis]|uniref:tRNA nucleotidyltransferase n=1 Tax=Rhodohalobacter barkolensis TaxID=2053187 RepID=A0A2N0VE18_9BACT|nr:HD domain-containing protein [Rhodohalobacter barkolensis]PKD42433.1 tRNA nucleotidyltransferase [Rhodohalobacter barkolensis]